MVLYIFNTHHPLLFFFFVHTIVANKPSVIYITVLEDFLV